MEHLIAQSLWPSRNMVGRLVGGDDVKAIVLEREIGGIRGQNDDVTSPSRRLAGACDLIVVYVAANHLQPEGIGDMQRSGSISAPDA